jgi:CDP-diacylglycerol--glycerol-3-phosphate 3-phosphatidyltransferase/cardiolipin synthase
MKRLVVIPAFISSLRIVALPVFFFLFAQENTVGCLILLTFCAFTDYLDGNLARRLEVTSQFGAYFDASTDFILMIGIFTIFYGVGYYPTWLLILIAASFIQFLASSQYTKKIYDPVGRYLGSTLYIGAVLTLIYPIQEAFIFVQYAFAGFFLASLISRIISLTRKHP